MTLHWSNTCNLISLLCSEWTLSQLTYTKNITEIWIKCKSLQLNDLTGLSYNMRIRTY